MKKIVFLAISLVSSAFVWGEAKDDVQSQTPQHKMSRLEIMSKKGYKINGGALVMPGSKTGSVAIVNAQKRVDARNINDVGAIIELNQNIAVRVLSLDHEEARDGSADASESTFAISVVDDGDLPTLLVAPEERWAKVNVAKLALGKNGKTIGGTFLESRTRKEILRAFSYLCGGAGSQFEGNILSINNVSQLDLYDEFIPLDVIKRAEKFMASCGVTPERIVTYRKAVEEGWAPQPTNEVQRVIWEKVKAEQSEKPSNPLKITPGMKPKGK